MFQPLSVGNTSQPCTRCPWIHPPPCYPLTPRVSLKHHSFNWIKLDFPKSPAQCLQTHGTATLMQGELIHDFFCPQPAGGQPRKQNPSNPCGTSRRVAVAEASIGTFDAKRETGQLAATRATRNNPKTRQNKVKSPQTRSPPAAPTPGRGRGRA